MKKKGFQVVSVLVAILMGTVLLAGCGSGSSTVSASSASSAASTPAVTGQQTTQSTQELKPVTLRFYFPWDKKADMDLVWNTISEKFKPQLNVKFDIEAIPFDDYLNKLLVMSAAGDNWDLNFDADWVAYPKMANKGAYLGVNDLLPQYAPNLYKTYQKDNVLDAVKVNGQITALPWTMKQNTRPFLMWRTDILQKAGISVDKNSIKTVQDVVALLEQAHKALPDLRYCLPNVNDWCTDGLLNLHYVANEYIELPHGLAFSLNDPKCTIVPVEQLPFVADWAKGQVQLYKDGLISKDAIVEKVDNGALSRSGKLPIQVVDHEWAYAHQDYSDNSSAATDSVLLYSDKKFPNRTALANAVCINKNAANPERTLMFLDLAETSQELYDLVNYGIKDKDYVLEGDAANYPAGMTDQTSSYMNWGGVWAFWKPQFMRPNPTYGKGFWQAEADFANSMQVNVNSPLDGWFVNTDSIKNEIAKRDQINGDLGKILAAGISKDPQKDLNALIQQQKDAGVDKIIAEYQKQVDAFLASKK